MESNNAELFFFDFTLMGNPFHHLPLKKPARMTIYLDFDGTVVEHAYPAIGSLNPRSLEVVRRLQDAGHTIILNTYRADLNDGSLEEAFQFFAEHGHILLPITSHTPQKMNPPAWNWEETMRSSILYIDDICKGTPMIPNKSLLYGQMVDWSVLESWFEEQGII